MRALAIVNPLAGGGRAARTWATISEAAKHVEYVRTVRPGHARQLASAAAHDGVERVIAVGGDGTVSEVASAIVHSNTTLAVVPAGSGNDFSRSIGVPTPAAAALRVALGGRIREVDVGTIESAPGACRTFVNVAGFGFDADVVMRTAASHARGRTRYVLGVLRCLRECRTYQTELEVDGHRLQRRVLLVAIANGPRLGGGMLIAPQARNDDGQLDVCIVNAVDRWEVLRLLPRMWSGGHRTHRAVEFVRCRELRAEAVAPPAIQADGELVGTLPVVFSVAPRALRCVVP